MISTLEKEITFRYLKTRKKDGFLNIISIFSFIGISLGVAVLIIVMSVMNGFRSELINKIVGFNAHITVKPYEKKYIDPTRLNFPQLNSISNNLMLSSSGEAIIDDTDENFSSKIKKMNLIGAPYQIIMGKQSDGDLLEFKELGKETQKINLAEIIKTIQTQKAKI